MCFFRRRCKSHSTIDGFLVKQTQTKVVRRTSVRFFVCAETVFESDSTGTGDYKEDGLSEETGFSWIHE